MRARAEKAGYCNLGAGRSLALSALFFVFISCLGGCRTSDVQRPDSCLQPTLEQIEAMAWSPDGSVLALMYDDSTSGARTVSKVDPRSLQTIDSVQAADALDALAVDDRGNPTWVVATVDGSASLVSWTADGTVSLGQLEHPRYFHLSYADRGFVSVEVSLPDASGPIPADASRLVRLELEGGTITQSPITKFDTSILDIAASLDGKTIATARSAGGGTTVDVAGAMTGTRSAEAGATSVDVWADGGRVGYRGDDGFYRLWDVSRSDETTIDDHWTTSARLSPTGLLAVAELTDSGPSGRVCINDLGSS